MERIGPGRTPATREEVIDEVIERGGEHVRTGIYRAVAGQAVVVITVLAIVALAAAVIAGVIGTGNCDVLAPCDPGGPTIAMSIIVMLLSGTGAIVLSAAAYSAWRTGRTGSAERARRSLRIAVTGVALTLSSLPVVLLFVLAGADLIPWD